MKQDEKNPKHWIADKGKVFKSLHDGQIMGYEIVLGTYRKDGEVVDDTIDFYVEIEDPNPEPESSEAVDE